MKSSLTRATLLLFSAGFATMAAAAVAADKTVELGGGKAVVFTLPAGWEIAPGEGPPEMAGLGGKTIKLSPKNGANAECDVTLFVPPDTRFADHDALREVLVTSGDSLVGDSVEGKVNASEFKTPHGFGYSATFTDKKLIGKASVHGDYKVATIVMFYLPEQIAVTASLLCDDVKGPDYAAMLALLRSLGARTSSTSI